MRKITTKYDLPLVEIQWVDAETDYGWESVSELDHELPVVVTVGFLVKHSTDKNGHGVYIIASSYGSGACNSRIKIPKGMVVKETVLYMPREGSTKQSASPAPVDKVPKKNTS